MVVPPPTFTLSIPNDLTVLPSPNAMVEVPVMIEQNDSENGSGGYNLLQIGLDYDELLRFGPKSWSLDGCAGTAVRLLHHDELEHSITLEIDFQPGAGSVGPEPIVKLLFSLSVTTWAKDQDEQYNFKTSAAITFDTDELLIERRGNDKSLQRPGEPPRILTRDGSLTIYLRDAVEIRSADLSRGRQTFVLPLYVTRISYSSSQLLLSVDYDQTYLSLRAITYAEHPGILSPRVDWEDKIEDGAGATIELAFKHGITPRMKRRHLLDLQFEYHANTQRTPETLSIVPGFRRDEFEIENGLLESLESAESVPGVLYFKAREFVRGDVDGSQFLSTDDVVRLLLASFVYGLDSIQCLEAADVDDNGFIDMTDPVYLLGYIFMGGPPPAAPYPSRGSNPFAGSDSDLGCARGRPQFKLHEAP